MINDNNKLIAYVLLVVLLNGFFSINISTTLANANF